MKIDEQWERWILCAIRICQWRQAAGGGKGRHLWPRDLLLLLLLGRVQASFLTVAVCLYLFIVGSAAAVISILLRSSILEVVALHLASFSPCCVCHMHSFFIFSSLPLVSCSPCFFAFWSYVAGISWVHTLSTWVQMLPCATYFFCCCSLHTSKWVWPVLFCGTRWVWTWLIQLYYGFIRHGVSLIMHASSLIPGIIVVHDMMLWYALIIRNTGTIEAFRQEAASIV